MRCKHLPSTFSVWFRHHREVLGHTQLSLARAIGITRSTVSSWEYAGVKPKDRFIPIICKMFSCDRDEVIACFENIVKADRHDSDEDPVIFPAIVGGKAVGCGNCSGEITDKCSRLVRDGLPILCESVMESDVFAVQIAGKVDMLTESRR